MPSKGEAMPDQALRDTMKKWKYNTLRVHVPNDWVLGVLVLAIVVQVLGKYMIIEYLNPWGYKECRDRKGTQDLGLGSIEFSVVDLHCPC